MSDVSKEAMAALAKFERDLDDWIPAGPDGDLLGELIDAGLVCIGDEGPDYPDVLFVTFEGTKALAKPVSKDLKVTLDGIECRGFDDDPKPTPDWVKR